MIYISFRISFLSSFLSFFLLAKQRGSIATAESVIAAAWGGHRVGKQTPQQRGREGRGWDGLGWDG